ncbi:recombinase family protein [Ruminococcus albus]|uniref:Resolvase, N-terminal domain protein n=1 Tax=Ruminococcus albus 8 TaxID=246199 RepID=E9S8G6_RUMAL|nr:recombinase family protein [Ruminococcus albus]EGC04449.1 resolvase, N-terminal domain protein [Ruminococcus albus 8]MCC3352386.1 recombinase family protein [Ruminococcus albus 8]
MLPKQTNYNVGMYLRLSKDDERSGESLSIENQRKVLTNYINEQGWTLYDEYVDDGYSGTSFERPGVQRLLEDAKNGKINLIICKDMSRFGRNYIAVGQYVDYIFPMYNIRFIALTDNIDTANNNSASMEMLPIVNVFNEWYAANTSKKLRAVIETNAKAGKYKTTFAAYGYDKGADENRTPVIDPETAPIVRRIFEMRASGANLRKIAMALNDDGILSPADYHYTKAGKATPLYSHHLWSTQAVKRILHNPIYIGTLARMKMTTVSYKNHKVIKRDESDWIVHENNHEAIISKELWDKVRELEDSVSTGKSTKTGEVKPLSGMCYCSTCGTKMKFTSSMTGKTPQNYTCGLYARFGKQYCNTHFITLKALESVVLADIQRQIDFVMNDDKAREKYLARKRGLNNLQENADRKRLQDITKRLGELDRLIETAYEDRALGRVPEKVCIPLLEKYQAEKDTLTAEYDELHQRTQTEQQDEADVDEYIRRLRSYAGAEQLTRQMALELIEYITIDENPNDKKAVRDIHVYYKLIDKPLKDRKNAHIGRGDTSED